MKNFLLLLLLGITTTIQSQTLKARDVFQQMPDSILPYLTVNNRLDMIDFMDSHMKARVQNKFDGSSEMLSLSDDSLSIQTSSVQRLTLRLQTSTVEIDGSHQVICLERTINLSSEKVQTVCTYYSIIWRKLDNQAISLVK